ncbi:putative receptor-like serine/threonine-protein kinase [Canna indica]|uniref:non-specific serine/threonine protein kinase n=1 Tax=Canna indica TaxID=4628 RepID=A0AAQ3K0L4_9LILI|nr:putative receptor-like serine/threonine-protein kinase [Canna indica]
MGEGIDPFDGFLAARTAVFGLPVYALITISIVALLVAVLFVLRRVYRSKDSTILLPSSSKDISKNSITTAAPNEIDKCPVETAKPVAASSRVEKPSEGLSLSSTEAFEKNMGNIGWGRWYTLAELEAATGGFNPENVLGKGGYGIVYRGVLPDLSVVAIKDLLNNKGQAENEFKMEVEAIGKVRHKNLVGLIGYCAEGPKRMFVYEYIDNGTLEQWLHGDNGRINPLTWERRMKIAIGTAKGTAYLHEGLEPKVVHRDIKSGNILLDKHWNPKVSDFGMAKVLDSGSSFVTTRVMGTFGYVAPEYACTGILNESHDVYSFGILLMEIISGRTPVDYTRPVGEVNIVEWFKRAVQRKREEEVVDPLIEIKPSPRSLKRVMLICLRCIDMDAQQRPKMGQIVHMLEGDDFYFRKELRSGREGIPISSVRAKFEYPINSGRWKNA